MSRLVLIVEDELKIRELVRRYLEREGLEVLTTGSGAEAITMAADARPDLVVLDLGLPDVPGEEVARELRADTDVPILMLTARSDERDRIAGLELGADDYVTKPFSPRELTLRVLAVLRRHGASDGRNGPSSYGAGALRIDEERHAVSVRGSEVELTPTEWGLLDGARAHAGPRVLALRADQPRARLRVRGLRAHGRLARQEPAAQDRGRRRSSRRSCRPCSAWATGWGCGPMTEAARRLSLRARLAVAFVAVAVAAVAALAVVMLAATRSETGRLSADARDQTAAQVTEELARAYRAAGSWEGADLSGALALAQGADAVLIVRDGRGAVVGGGHVGRGPQAGRGAGMTAVTRAIDVGGARAGTAELRFRGALTPRGGAAARQPRPRRAARLRDRRRDRAGGRRAGQPAPGRAAAAPRARRATGAVRRSRREGRTAPRRPASWGSSAGRSTRWRTRSRARSARDGGWRASSRTSCAPRSRSCAATSRSSSTATSSPPGAARLAARGDAAARIAGRAARRPRPRRGAGRHARPRTGRPRPPRGRPARGARASARREEPRRRAAARSRCSPTSIARASVRCSRTCSATR